MARPAGAISPGRGRGRSARTPKNEPALVELGERILETGEIVLQQPLQRARRARPQPRARWRCLLEQLQQDPDLGAAVLLARDQRERVAVEDLQQLCVLEAEQGLKARSAQNS